MLENEKRGKSPVNSKRDTFIYLFYEIKQRIFSSLLNQNQQTNVGKIKRTGRSS